MSECIFYVKQVSFFFKEPKPLQWCSGRPDIVTSYYIMTTTICNCLYTVAKELFDQHDMPTNIRVNVHKG